MQGVSPSRPPYTTSQTATTILSTTSYTSSAFDHRSITSTALTTPGLGSPGRLKDSFEPMLEISEGIEESTDAIMDPIYAEEGQEDQEYRPRRTPSISRDLSRGPSVKDRASQFEQQQASSSSSSGTRRPLPQPLSMGRTRSTSPLRINRKTSNTTDSTGIRTPTNVNSNGRRVPVPATEPVQRIAPGDVFDSHTLQKDALRGTPPELKRGTGSAKRMIQQWESLPTTPADHPRLPGLGTPRSARIMNREYLEKKPLPIPQATQIPAASSSYSPGPSRPSPRSAYVPSPLQHLQTPHSNRKRSSTLTPSPSSYSMPSSPSNDKRKRAGGRSPLKDMLNKFGGGIQAFGRKAKGKGKEKGMGRSESYGISDDDLGMERVGSNGLPGGIVFRDRMGEAEMSNRGPSDPNAVRTSAVMYLIPTPCSSVAPWGSWLSSWATLTSTTLHVTYCPIFQDPKSGHSTPRRVLSGTNPSQTSFPAVPFSSIPQPDPSTSPDVELAMRDCIEVRSLRRDEVKGRGIPPVPEGVGTEVLEMAWSDGSKRYIGVEGVAGRLGWVSSIWDVLLACKTDQPPSLPPPSPIVQRAEPSSFSPLPTSSIASLPYPATSQPRGELSDFRARLASLEARSGGSSAPPVQKFGDTWVAASALEAGSSEVEVDKPLVVAGVVTQDRTLRNSVQRMFEIGPDADPALGALAAMELLKEETMPTRRNSEISERIMAWQPTTERELSIFSRTGNGTGDECSTRNSDISAVPSSEIEREREFNSFSLPSKTETTLGFDPNDLNPSRSASQVRRTPSFKTGTGTSVIDKVRRYGYLSAGAGVSAMPALEEQSSDGQSKVSDELGKPSSHISHVTFPKPTLSGQQMMNTTSAPGGMTRLPTIHSAPGSSCETGTASGRSEELQTPRTTHSSMTTMSASASASHVDPMVLAKLDSHTNEHFSIAKQMDNVQVDLQQIITSLGGLIRYTKTEDLPIPKVLDDKLDDIRLDVKGIENALQLSTLATNRQQLPLATTNEEPKLLEVHDKLDSIFRLCEQVLAKQVAPSHVGEIHPISDSEIDGLPGKASRVKSTTPGIGTNNLGVSESEEEKSAGQEVAQIMADLTEASSKTSPKLGGLQVLHNASAPPSPKPASSPVAGLPNVVIQQVGEVLDLVKELKEARSLQTQQTTDIARYLNELNAWLEKFVVNSSSELGSMSKKLEMLVGPDLLPADGAPVPVALPDMIADVHSMMSEQKKRNDEEGMVGHRLDALLRMMGEDKERQATQQSTVEQVVSIIDRQRHDNEMLLRALATDLTTEIRGERIRFVEAMQQATSVNVAMHVEEFKKVLAAEVDRSMKELGAMREEKKVLEHQISDLFAIMAKHSGGGGKSKKGAPSPATAPIQGMGMGQYSPMPMNRGLPAPPPR